MDNAQGLTAPREDRTLARRMPRRPAREVMPESALRRGLTFEQLLAGERPRGMPLADRMSYGELYRRGGPGPAQFSRVIHDGAAMSEIMLGLTATAFGIDKETARVAYVLARREHPTKKAAKGGPDA